MDNGSSGRLVNHEEGRGRGSRISRTAAGSSRGGVSASGPAAAASARSSARPSARRSGYAEQYYADKKYKEAVAVAVAKCADDTIFARP